MTRIANQSAARVLAAASLCLGILAGVPGGEARAEGVADEADLHFQIATEHYQRGEFREALEHFFASNRLVPNKNVVFNIARTFEQLRRFADAHRYYVDALELETNPQTINDINAAIRRITPNVAVLRVETTPPGATIYIDRKDLGARGRAPRPLALPAGRYRVIAELEGYEPATAAEVQARLVGKVEIAVTGASGAEVRVDNEKGAVGCNAPCALEASPGRHVLYFSREGYQATPRPLTVVEKETIRVSVELRPLTGSLVVSADEPEALVEVDGRRMGFTPAVLQSVAVGRRRVRVSLRGYFPVERDVEIQTGREAQLVDLKLT